MFKVNPVKGIGKVHPPDRRLRVTLGWSRGFEETELISSVENQTMMYVCPCTLEKAAGRYFLTVFNDFSFSTTEITLHITIIF
jgi:hypothetical protein